MIHMLMEHGKVIRGLNRPFKPYLFSVALAMLVITQSNIREMDRGTEIPLSYVVAFLAGSSSVSIVVGWVMRRHEWLLFGLAISVCTWVTRASFIQFENPWDQAVFFSLINAFAAGGAYVLEAQGFRHEQAKEVK